MSRAARLVREGLWAFGGQATTALAVLASLKLWAVYLDPAQVGLMGLVVGGVSILVAVLITPVTQAVLIDCATRPQDQTAIVRDVASRMVIRQCLVIVGGLLAIGVPAAYFMNLGWALPLLAAGLVAIEARRAFEIALLASKRRQKAVAVIYGGDSWFRFAGLWLTLHFLSRNAETAILGTLFGAAVFIIVSNRLLRRESLGRSRCESNTGNAEIKASLVRLAKPLYPAMLLSNITEMLNRYLIAATIGLGASGMFIVSYGLVKRPYGLLNGVTDWTMRPALAAAISEGDRAKALLTKWMWLAVGGGAAVLGAALFYLLRDLIVQILLTPEYAVVAQMLPGIALAVALFNIANIFGGFSLAAGDSRALLINSAVGAFAGGILTVVLCLRFGLQGAVWALVGAYLLQLIVSAVNGRRSSPQRQN